MSLYYVQKLLYQLNRDPHVRKRYDSELDELLTEYDLTAEEIQAIKALDLGLLYVIGVNGQILMHFSALHGIAWPDYIEALRQGLKKYGPVREGVYAETGYQGIAAHDEALRARRAATSQGKT
ncbi:MAG: aromatic ring-opening dioxygenase subunit LigA [Alphaproteobacteria bacterium]|jgi:hypothetical protein|nr:aromatic ring-opening dioxygenase subunit LigA [Alphaproteobacteria bacterium]|tara:strand:+ start:160 stop:528 length:369 start_codon:yes stop_codon:yes gene_type:complete